MPLVTLMSLSLSVIVDDLHVEGSVVSPAEADSPLGVDSKRALLYKSLIWAHEDEVRLLKWVHDSKESGIRRRSAKDGGSGGYLYQLPKGSLQEVHFLMRPIDVERLNDRSGRGTESKSEFRVWVREVSRDGINVYGTVASEITWEYETHRICPKDS